MINNQLRLPLPIVNNTDFKQHGYFYKIAAQLKITEYFYYGPLIFLRAIVFFISSIYRRIDNLTGRPSRGNLSNSTQGSSLVQMLRSRIRIGLVGTSKLLRRTLELIPQCISLFTSATLNHRVFKNIYEIFPVH